VPLDRDPKSTMSRHAFGSLAVMFALIAGCQAIVSPSATPRAVPVASVKQAGRSPSIPTTPMPASSLAVGQPVTANVLVVVGDATTPTTTDAAIKTRLKGLGHTVTYMSDETAEPSLASYDLIVIAESVSPDTLGTKYAAAAVPIILHDYSVAELTGWDLSTEAQSTGTQTQVTVTDAAHPAASGQSGNVTVLDAPASIWMNSAADVGPGALNYLGIVGHSTSWAGYYYPAGSAMLNSHQAEHRRIILGFFHESQSGTQTASAWTFFDGAVAWALGQSLVVQLVVGDSGSPSRPDLLLKRRLEGLGHVVTYVDDSTTAATHGIDLVVIFESVVAATLGSKYAASDVPLLNGEHSSWGAHNMTNGGFTDHDGRDDIEIFKPDPIDAGYSGTVKIFDPADPTVDVAYVVTTGLGAGVVSVGRFPDARSKICIFRYDVGATMWSGRAPERRVGLDFSDEGVGYSYTDVASNLFEASVAWLGRTPRPYPRARMR
jgi:hypothetical protein